MAAQLHFGAGDSVGFGTTAGGVSSTASFNKSDLSNMQVGDLLVAWIHDQSSTTGTVTAPSGWTQYGAAIGTPNMSTSRTTGFYYYAVRASTDISGLATAPTWSFTSGTRIACVVARATGIDLDNIEDAASSSFSGGTGGAALTINGITTTNATTLLVGGLFHENAISTSAPNTTSFMSVFQEYRTNPDASFANTGAALAYSYLTTAGSTGNIGATFDNSTTLASGELVAFKAGPWSPSGTITRPALIGSPTTYTTSNATTSFTISTPAGVQDGDVLVLALSGQTSNAATDFSSSGWTRVGQPFAGNSSTYRLTGFYAFPVVSAAAVASSYTFSDTEVSGAGGRVCATMVIVRNADQNNLVVAYSPYGVMSGSTVTVQPGSLTYDNSLLLVNYNAQFVSGVDYTVATTPTGTTLITSLINSTGAVSKTQQTFYQMDVDHGNLAADVQTWNGAPAQATGSAIVIHASNQTSVNPGIAVQYTSAPDTLSDASLYYTSATDTLASPLEVRPVPTGYASVSDMLATYPFYVAHRGGSKDWPEMSLHAYTQSVFWGMGALELSLARTSDGVWFGLHDSSLDRTSLNTGGGSGTTLVASSMTWAQVQQYQIQYPNVSNPASLPQPYMRWEEIIAAYYNSHVLFVDPKYASSYTSELLSMMDALPGSTSRFVGKSYGTTGNTANTTGFPHEAAAHGYKNWGYFYEADYSNVPTYQGRYDILGMDYTATSTSWTQIMSYGKPVMGHIAPSAAAITTALGYGAVGVMVSGVQEAVPRST